MRRSRPFAEKYKRVSQNITKRKEKERKERMERQKQLLYASQDEADRSSSSVAVQNASSTNTAAEAASHPVALPYGFSGLNQKKAPAPKPSIFDKLSWKKSFHEKAKDLKGPALYDFYVPTPPAPPAENDPPKKKQARRTDSLEEDEAVTKKNAQGDKEKEGATANTVEEEIDESKWHDYLKKLFDVSVQVDANMSARINAPPGLIENYPVAQLFVVDVYVSLPKPNRPETSNKRGSVTPTSHSAVLFPVDLHQVIGIFPCESEKCPANLDCGLFEYDYFHGLYVEQQRKLLNPVPSDDQSVGSTQSGSTVGSSLTNPSGMKSSHHETDPIRCYLIKDKNWNPADPNTGISFGRSHTPTGGEFQYHLLGQWPNKEFMEKNLPKKVKLWLGLPT